jgi:uncharacterized protein YlaI
MIEIKKSENYEFCLNCRAEQNLRDVRFSMRNNANNAIVVTLCPNCLARLDEKIKEVLNEDKEFGF